MDEQAIASLRQRIKETISAIGTKCANTAIGIMIQELADKGIRYPVGTNLEKYIKVLGTDSKESRAVTTIGLEKGLQSVVSSGRQTIPPPAVLKTMCWEAVEDDRVKLKGQRDKLALMTGLDADRWYGASVYNTMKGPQRKRS